MGKPNFFADTDVLNCLLGMQYDPKVSPVMDLTVDVPDLPIWFSLKSNAQEHTLTLYTQTELYMKNEGMASAMGHVIVNGQTGQVKMSVPQGIDQKNVAIFYMACRNLSIFAKEKGLATLWADDDPEQCGILLEQKNGSLTWRKVSGMDRPELLVQQLFGGTIKMRPYMEDFWDRSETDMMSLEEKIEKAEGGDKFAMAKLAQVYLDGDDEVEQDPKKAAYWFRKEAELQDSEGAFNLGLMYAKGFGVERDFVQAAEWMEKAVAWGDSDGAAPAKQYRAMAENLKKAGAGDAAAMAEVAGTYMAMGGSLAQAGAGGDYAESLKWAQKAVNAGCAAGYWPLALAYEHGRGVKKNDRKAVELYKKGADLGHAACQHSYGCRLMTGEGAKKDVKQALALFERSAAQGYGLAYQALGRMYETGEGVEPDFDKEMEYYEKACEALPNNAEFLRHVGYQYVNLMDGNEAGWLRAVERASYWLHKAADLGDRTAMGGADTFDRILELHRQGKIPAGSGMDKCMAYLEGKTPAKKNGGRPQAKQPSKARTGAAAPAVKTQKDDGQARKKAEEEAKTIHDAVRRAWDEGLSAKRAYDRCTTEVNIKTSRALDYFSDDFESKLSEIVELSLDACRDLFDVCQAQVCTVDRICRPLLNSTRSYSEIKKVAEVIRWLNETSVIEKQFDLSVNSTELGNVSEVKLAPEQKCIDIQRFWEETLLKMPKPPMEGPKEQEKWKTEKERKSQETTVKRSGAEPAKPVQKGQQEAQSSPQNEAEQLTPTQRWAREQAEQLKKRQQSAQNGPQKETEQLTPAQRWAREQAEELRKRRQEAESSKQKEAERKAAEEERQREEERKKEEARQIEAEKRREAERKKAEAERIEAEKKLEKARKKRERKRLIGIALTAAGALVSLAGIVMGTEYGKWLLLLFPGAYLLWFGLKLLYSL